MSNIGLIAALGGSVTLGDTLADFPTSGIEDELYLATTSGVMYRWTGTAYAVLANGGTNLTFVGTYDASSNTPNAMTTLTTNGQTLIVTVAGEQTIDTIAYTGANSLRVGDFLVETTGGIRRIPFQTAIFQSVTSGRIPLITDGVAGNSAIRETTTQLISDKTLVVPQGSLDIGAGVTESEVGGIVTYLSHVTENRYSPVLYPVEQNFQLTNDDKPFYFRLGALDNTFRFLDVDTTNTTVTSFDYTPPFSFVNHELALNFVNPVTNLRIRVTSTETGEVVRYFPSRRAWEAGEGVSASAGVQTIFTAFQDIDGEEQLPFAFTSGITYTQEYMADQAIVLLGDGTNPWASGNIRRVTITKIALEDELSTVTDSDAVHVNVENEINQIPRKTTISPNDVLIIESIADNAEKRSVLVSQLMGGSATPIRPSVHNFSIDLPSRVNVNLSPDTVNAQHTVTFGITNYAQITGIVLHIGTQEFTLTNPTSDGTHTQTVTLSGIDLSTATTYNMFLELNDDNSLRSNIRVLTVANPLPHELLYWDVQTSSTASDFNFQSATALSQDITGNSNTITVQTFTGSMYLAIAQPASEDDFTSIMIDNFEQLGAFTKNAGAVTINSESYDVWLSNNALTGSIVSGDQIVLTR